MLFANGKGGADPPKAAEIPIEVIVTDPQRSKSSLEGRGFAELVAEAKRTGSVEPVVVRPAGNVFELMLGERRLAAARLAGLKRVPALVRDVSSREAEMLSLLEELQRDDVNVVDEARGYRRLCEEFELTQADVGRAVGKSQSTIANKLRLLKLADGVLERVVNEGVSERHARTLLDLSDAALQHRVLDQIRDHGLSVRETEHRVRALAAEPTGVVQSPPPPVAEEGTPQPPWAPGAPGSPPAEVPAGTGRGQPRLFGAAGGPAPRAASSAGLGQFSDRRAIRVFRDVRLFLNTFRRAVEMLREAGVAAEMTETDTGGTLEIKVSIPLSGAGGRAPVSAKGLLGTKDAPGGRG